VTPPSFGAAPDAACPDAIIRPMTTSAGASSTPPVGTVTFLFSDIEGSTRLLEQLGNGYATVLQLHRTAMRRAFAEHGGVERGTEGDSFFVAFAEAGRAVSAAADATRNLAAQAWPDNAAVRVRMGLHTGEGRLVDGDYVGIDVHRAARIAAAGHGGQVLLSESTRILGERGLREGDTLRDLGEHQLKDLPAPEHLYQLVLDGQPNEFPPLRSLTRTVTNLPAQLPSIIGRDTEIAMVQELLLRSRLVTVTGPGGTGKTRLVQEVARTIAASAVAEVAFVPLDALHDADFVPNEIVRALRLDIAAAHDPLERLAEHIASRPTILVLDNLEQLPTAGLAVRSLLDRLDSLSVLVSSQAALHVAGEQEIALQPLALADVANESPPELQEIAGNPAIALFVERARAVRADFQLDASNAAAVTAICARLDGLPLAIELAAAQVKMLSPEVILQRLEGSLDSLASRRDDLAPRHRTLRATVSWSHDLLGDEERRLFRRLAVFSGGARLPEIEAIGTVAPPIADPIDVLSTLVDRSLVSVRHAPGGESRYVVLETMRTFGAELLSEHGEAGAMALAHAHIYADLAQTAEPEFYRPDRRAWLDRIAAEHGNLRVALDSLLNAGEVTVALGLAADLWRFWQQRGHFSEGIDRLQRILDAASRPGAAEVSPRILSRAEEAIGNLYYWFSPDRRISEPWYLRAVEHAVESGDRAREAWASYNLAFVYDFVPQGFGTADIPRATELRARSLAMFRTLGDRRGVGESLWAMGGSAQLVLQDSAAARRHLSEAIPILDEVGDLFAIGWAHISIGLIEAVAGSFDAAEDHVLAAAEVFTHDRDIAGEAIAVQHLGGIAARRGDDITAIRFNAAARARAASFGTDVIPIPPVIEPILAAEARVAPQVLDREREIGRALGVDAILSTALEAWRASQRGADRPVVR
jgi:predicted ATPase/class 3 adenylate cyclase